VAERYLRRGGNFWPVEPVLARPHRPLVLSTTTRHDIHLAPLPALTLAPVPADRTSVADRSIARYLRRDAAAGPGAAVSVSIPVSKPAPAAMPGHGAVPSGGAVPPAEAEAGAGAGSPGYAPVPREVRRTGPYPRAGATADGPVAGPGSPARADASAAASWRGGAGPAPTLRPQDTERLTADLAQRLGDRLAGQLTERVIRGLDRRQLARWERQAGTGEGGAG